MPGATVREEITRLEVRVRRRQKSPNSFGIAFLVCGRIEWGCVGMDRLKGEIAPERTRPQPQTGQSESASIERSPHADVRESASMSGATVRRLRDRDPDSPSGRICQEKPSGVQNSKKHFGLLYL